MAKFQDHDWVFLGEYHRIRADVELVGAVIPELHRRTRVRRLALEFLCHDRTDAANRLVTAGSFDRREAMAFFRDQFASWSYEEYLDLFRVTWESNRVHGPERGPFLLVGLNPCPDWEVVNYSTDEAAVKRELDRRDRYDAIMAEALEARLLQPGLPSLVFTGVAHSTAKFTEYFQGTGEPLPRMGNLVRREPYQGRMFFIALHAPLWDAGSGRDIYPFDGVLDRLMARYLAPIGFDVVGTPFATLRHASPSPRSITAYSFGDLYDGYVMHAVPLKETIGVTCISDWVTTEAEFRHFWRHLTRKEASEEFGRMSLDEFRADVCDPRPDHGLAFPRRFRDLPDTP